MTLNEAIDEEIIEIIAYLPCEGGVAPCSVTGKRLVHMILSANDPGHLRELLKPYHLVLGYDNAAQ